MTIRNAVVGISAVVLAGCAGDTGINREAGTMLEPMSKPATVPTEITWAGTGANGVQKVLSVNGGMVTWQRTEGDHAGCQWTDDGWFAPSSTWSGCRTADGEQEFAKTGSIWPLEVGTSESYDVKGQNSSDSWQTTRNCTVKSAVLVTVGERELPAYEVACEDKWSVQTWYVSPELEMPVRYKNWNKKGGLRTDVTAVL